jgi:replication fork clamp-binding protein CrfC
VKYVEAKVSAINAYVARANSDIELERARVTGSAAAVSSKAQAFSVDVSRYAEEIKASGIAAESATRILELRLRNNLAYYETQVKEYDAKLGRLLEQSKLVVESLRSAGQFSAALAQGAMSAIHLNASMQATGHASSTNTYTQSFNENHNYKHGG